MSQDERTRIFNRGLPAGTRLNGIYEIDEIIGSGGMGEVYRGHEVHTGAPVAIKMLLSDMAENEAALALFRREASAIHNLPHDAIVRYFLFTVDPTLQRPYLAMEFVNGQSLSDILLQTGALHFDRVVKLVRRVASGFQAAHERGIIHRDVSPDNIIIPRGDVAQAKIIDFGIARQIQVGDPTIIGSGFAGKENYASPEQVGLFGGEVTAKSDIYSLGLVVFYAVTGVRLEMAGTQYQLVEKRSRVPDLSAVDPRFRPLLERMLQPDPANRPASMAEVADWNFPSKGEVSHVERSRAAVLLGDDGSPDGRTRRKLVFGLLAVSLIVAAGGFGFYRFVWSAKSPSVPPSPQPEVASPQPSPRTKDGATRVAQIRSFVDHYDGGDCFFVFPVAVSQSATVLEGFAASNARFQAFAASFKRDQGFEPSVGTRQVTDAQCPAVRFLRQLHGDPSRAPRIVLESMDVRNGETLSGSLENLGSGGGAELILVTDKGQVKSLTSLLKPGLDSMSFSIGLQSADNSARPQLLMALTSSRPISKLGQPQLGTADEFFESLLSEARKSNATIESSVRYFKLGG